MTTQPFPLAVRLDMLAGYKGDLLTISGRRCRFLCTVGPSEEVIEVLHLMPSGRAGRSESLLVDDVVFNLRDRGAFGHLLGWAHRTAARVDMSRSPARAILVLSEVGSSNVGALLYGVGSDLRDVMVRHFTGETTDHNLGSLRAVCLELVRLLEPGGSTGDP